MGKPRKKALKNAIEKRKPFGFIPKSKKEKISKNPVIPGRYHL